MFLFHSAGRLLTSQPAHWPVCRRFFLFFHLRAFQLHGRPVKLPAASGDCGRSLALVRRAAIGRQQLFSLRIRCRRRPPRNQRQSQYFLCVARLSHSESIALDRPHPPAAPWPPAAITDGLCRCSSVASHCIHIPSDFHKARFSSCSWPVGAAAVGVRLPRASDPVLRSAVQISRGSVSQCSSISVGNSVLMVRARTPTSM